jgi:transcriptional regulator with XRE-family HTH domain
MGAEPEEGRAIESGVQARAVRELSGISRARAAKSAGLTRRQIAKVERGRRELSVEEARALAGALGVEADVLVADTLDFSFDVDERIDDVVGHDPEEWAAVPRSVADLPAALPFDLPESDRRADLVTRTRIERSWEQVRGDMDDVLAACTKVATAGSGEDLRSLLRELEDSVERLADRRSFERKLTRHERKLADARSPGLLDDGTDDGLEDLDDGIEVSGVPSSHTA